MAGTYELWETESGNLMGFYDSEDDALAAVRQGIKAHGVESVATIALVHEDSHGRSRALASGAELLLQSQAHELASRGVSGGGIMTGAVTASGHVGHSVHVPDSPRNRNAEEEAKLDRRAAG